tara:strand:- start:20966 stop:22297 length:1332 start_codon:yes stop_codon:yes gene_type:complete
MGIIDSATGGPTTQSPAGPGGNIFITAVVVDFISNPAAYDLESLRQGLPGQVENDIFIDKMPRNSIIAKIVTDGQGQGGSPPTIMYPFFPPHLSLPVKPGEHVWVVFEKLGDQQTIPYWFCRKSTDITVDDLNYTHLDRVKMVTPEIPQSTSDVYEETTEVDYFSFPLGGGAKKSNNTLSGDNPYEDLIGIATSYSQFTGEAVPRFSKRAPDLVLQGSNNTLISLGEDRPSLIDNDPAMIGVGSIDIVAGRGQDVSTAPVATSPNARGFTETNKTPVQTMVGTDNILEGDPDFINDLSRIYLSMGTNADENFGISIVGDTPSGVGPAVAIKTDQARIIGRTDVKLVAGIASESSICVKSDGTIYIGANGDTQPAYRGTDLLDAIEAFADAIDAALGTAGGTIPTGVPTGNLVAPLLHFEEISTACDTLKRDAALALSTTTFIK